ncbi:AIPR family protein [Clostridium hydrogenum]|uniref:AIPR family protein n=1 Tax=Clostridium hydrogenum TaxID=2855764 RepID=UPI002E2EBA58|nr:AIPR family protein [Clostridium hydrogenum]
MSILYVNQIKRAIETIYKGIIDLSDYDGKKQDEKKDAFLTRALCAYSIQSLTGAEPIDIVKCITDGFDDNGIDAIYYKEEANTLFLVQSKWNHTGTKSPELGAVDKFITGITDIISFRFEKFNKKIKEMQNDLEEILCKKGLKIKVLLAYTGPQLSKHVKDKIESFLETQNSSNELFYFENINQGKLLMFLHKGLNENVDLDGVILSEWGKKETPHLAYSGFVDGMQIANWWSDHGVNLFSRNIRMLLADSDINEEIKETILKEPDMFWYYNNGITMICESIGKRVANGSERNYGMFDCKNISIINGAQTVGTIGKYAESTGLDKAQKKLEKINVQLRIISTSSSEFKQEEILIDRITKSNNRQNKIENRDFVSLDINQKTIKNELSLLKINYYVMRSEEIVIDEKSFDLVESTRSLSNALNITASTLVHREPSKIWSDINHDRYKSLFSKSAIYIWNIVQCQRIIDNVLKEVKGNCKGEDKAIISYGEDFISCLMFNKIKTRVSNNIIGIDEVFNGIDIKNYILEVRDLLKNEIKRIGKGVPTVFKNYTDCENMHDKLVEM